MNAGFSNLAKLKEQLLTSALRSGTAFDPQVLAVGLGMASMIEEFCHRKFARAVATTEILPADRCNFLLSRYPVEAVTKIEIKHTEADGWEEQTINDLVTTINLASGIVHTPESADLGPFSSQVRFTYTGGFHWNTLEETGGAPTPLPAGATALPDALYNGWLMQCRAAWQALDKLGKDIGKTGSDSPFATNAIGELKMLPVVALMIRPYVRENWC